MSLHSAVSKSRKDKVGEWFSLAGAHALTLLTGQQNRHPAHKELEALGQCISLPRHILTVRSRSGSDLWSGLPPKFNRLFTGSLAHIANLPRKFHANLLGSFFVQSCEQTIRQTNNDDYISSMAEVITNEERNQEPRKCLLNGVLLKEEVITSDIHRCKHKWP